MPPCINILHDYDKLQSTIMNIFGESIAKQIKKAVKLRNVLYFETHSNPHTT